MNYLALFEDAAKGFESLGKPDIAVPSAASELAESEKTRIDKLAKGVSRELSDTSPKERSRDLMRVWIRLAGSRMVRLALTTSGRTVAIS